ncbi:DUF2254 family protein [Nitrosopumilus sp.]|uniref:DUF2254 family protein n=1 Tax=Nitrosopumilus sp. TaxID=2024843 RepID=UPI00247D208B|nr:DUF2254 family protein [Nitrosopumilus sp.]MCV0410770.1 DUF2254 domain-containing protein [Nitrosopumilus sp.]
MKSSNFSKFYISFIVYSIVLVPILFHFQTLNNYDNESFLPSAIEATSALVAIVFAISILVIQHAASNYTPTVLNNFKNDKIFWFTLSYGIFTIMILSTSLVFEWKILLLNLFLFLNNIGLLAVFFIYTFKKINPISIVNEIQDKIVNEFTNVHKKIDELKTEYSKKDTTGKYGRANQLFPEITSHSVLTNNPTLLPNIITYELTLRQIILESVKKGDYDTSRAGLNVYSVVLANYLNIIPNYSWHGDQFITKILEKIKTYSIDGFQTTNIILLEDIISTLQKCGVVFAEKIELIGGHMESNQPLSLCMKIAYDIAITGLTKQLFDLASDSIKTISALGLEASEKYNHDHLAVYYIVNIGNTGIKLKDFYVPQIATYYSFIVIRNMIKNKLNRYTITNEIEDISKMLQSFIETKIQNLWLSGTVSEIAESGPIPCILECVNLKNANYPKIQTKFREEITIDVVSEIIDLVGKTGYSAKKVHDNSIGSSCADSLVSIASLIASEKFVTEKKHPEEELKQIIYRLSNLHRYDPEIHTTYGRDIVKRIVEVILYCLKNNYLETAKLGINLIFNLSNKVLETDELGYEAIRTLESLDVIGCYGIAKNQNEILILTADKYVEFEERFEAIFGKKPSDPTSHQNRYVIDEYDQMHSKYKPFEDIQEIMNPQNGKEFELVISELRDIRTKAKKQFGF